MPPPAHEWKPTQSRNDTCGPHLPHAGLGVLSSPQVTLESVPVPTRRCPRWTCAQKENAGVLVAGRKFPGRLGMDAMRNGCHETRL